MRTFIQETLNKISPKTTLIPPGGRHTFVAKTVEPTTTKRSRNKSVDNTFVLTTTSLKSRKDEVSVFSKAQLIVEPVTNIRSKLKYEFDPGHIFLKNLYE